MAKKVVSMQRRRGLGGVVTEEALVTTTHHPEVELRPMKPTRGQAEGVHRTAIGREKRHCSTAYYAASISSPGETAIAELSGTLSHRPNAR